jgi:hypothetical protein
MANVNFNPPEKKKRDEDEGGGTYLEVSGPFELDWPRAEMIGALTVRFLLIQKVDGGATPEMVDHTVEFPMPQAQKTTWTAEVDVADDLPVGKYRTVGQAIVVRRNPPPDPPLFETLTWCVTREILDKTGGSTPS